VYPVVIVISVVCARPAGRESVVSECHLTPAGIVSTSFTLLNDTARIYLYIYPEQRTEVIFNGFDGEKRTGWRFVCASRRRNGFRVSVYREHDRNVPERHDARTTRTRNRCTTNVVSRDAHRVVRRFSVAVAGEIRARNSSPACRSPRAYRKTREREGRTFNGA